jgi:hypothetical protein
MTSLIYYSSSTSRFKASFETIPFNGASIEFNREKASTASFNSIEKLNEGDRIRIVGDNHRTFGGQIVKPGSKIKDGAYSYDCVDYTRLFFGKATGTYSKKTSYQIIKSILDKLNYSTAGLEKTTKVHSTVSWKATNYWDIIQQLRYLDYKAGQLIDCYVNADGTLIYQPMPQTHEGYIFKSAYDYSQSYDASDIVTAVTEYAENNGVVTNLASVKDTNLVAVWGNIYELESGC